VVLGDALPNLVRNPAALWRVGHLARTADLTAELEELKDRGLPVVVLWGRRDSVLPPACLASMRQALGDPQVITVDGNHSWLLSDPRAFGEIMTNVVGLVRGESTDAA
jgi:pimeloyl-ACP methyl ester carboxylesterase